MYRRYRYGIIPGIVRQHFRSLCQSNTLSKYLALHFKGWCDHADQGIGQSWTCFTGWVTTSGEYHKHIWVHVGVRLFLFYVYKNHTLNYKCIAASLPENRVCCILQFHRRFWWSHSQTLQLELEVIKRHGIGMASLGHGRRSALRNTIK